MEGPALSEVEGDLHFARTNRRIGGPHKPVLLVWVLIRLTLRELPHTSQHRA